MLLYQILFGCLFALQSTATDESPESLLLPAVENAAQVQKESPAEENVDDSSGAEPSSEEPSQKELSPEEQARKAALNRCLAVYYTKQVDADVLRPWSIMHGLIAYGSETQILSRGRRINAVEYLCGNGIGDDRRMLFVRNGQLQTRIGRGVQGHPGQFLAMLAQSDIPADHPIAVDGHRFTIEDLIELEKRGCQSGTELTFRLIGLSHYLDSDAVWKNQFGEQWSISRLLKEELNQPVNDGACGGAHRLMSLGYAVARRRDQQKPIEGQWSRADRFVNEFFDYAYHFQGESGSFSTEWFRKRNLTDNDARQRLYTTGHILEWLVFSLPEQRLSDPQITRAVDFLLSLMLAAPNHDLDVGPRGHALHALRMYEERVFGKSDHTYLLKDQALVHSTTPPTRTRTTNGRPPHPPAQNVSNQHHSYSGQGRRGLFGRRR